jgi:hypothetical protein
MFVSLDESIPNERYQRNEMLIRQFSNILNLSTLDESKESPPEGPSTLAIFASVVPSAMAPPPNSLLCFSRAITYVKKQKKLLGSGVITDKETDAKNASVNSP